MGEQKVNLLSKKRDKQRFVKSLLEDLEALEYMMNHDWFESDIVRIGAEQEMVLVDGKTLKPAPIAMEALELLKQHEWCETELAKFNLEINLDPQEFTGHCLSNLETEIRTKLNTINEAVKSLDSRILLTGILPSLRKYDLDIKNLTPKKRYKALMDAIAAQNQHRFHELRLLGVDELIVKHNTPFIEACNTSFQVHLQVAPQHFVQLYNISQAITAPILAISANSPILFGRRLWHETRIALFQQSLDTRASLEHMRERHPRVSFGSNWLDNSILDIYREDVSRFRALIFGDEHESSLDKIRSGKTPKLKSLQIHNSTVYRWNRPCYGISDNGKPHLRIENRIFAAGPSVNDEMANAALWLGAMKGYQTEIADIRNHIGFVDVKDNFHKAARYGIDSTFSWMRDSKVSATDLVINEIIPMARQGLNAMAVASEDIDKYLGIVEERARKKTTGARWMLRTYTSLLDQAPRDEAITALTASILANQSQSKPVHHWEEPTVKTLKEYRPSAIRIDEFMSTDFITGKADDTIDLIADLMIWKRLRYMMIEDDDGKLVGIITAKRIMKELAQLRLRQSKKTPLIGDLMQQDLITIDPESSIKEALKLFRKHKIGCLPVVRDQQLIGSITDGNLMDIATRLIERLDHE